MSMRYDDVATITKEAVLNALASGDVAIATKALIDGAFNIEDWQWMQERCLELTNSQEPWLRKTALIALGHIARIHGHLNLRRVFPVLEKMLDDPVQMVCGAADDTMEGLQEVWKPVQDPP